MPVNPKATEKQGYHQFAAAEAIVRFTENKPYGSFEVFWNDDVELDPGDEIGWYWWACFPGCLPDGDPSGPFDTSQEAYADAQEEA